LEESLAVYDGLRDDVGKAGTLVTMGNVAYQTGDRDHAMALHNQALAMHRAIGGKHRIAVSLQCLGFLTLSFSNDPAGPAQVREALALNQELGDKDGQAVAFYALAYAAFLDGDYAAAAVAAQECLALRQELGDKAGTASALVLRGLVELSHGKSTHAQATAIEALSLAESIGKQAAVIESNCVLSGAYIMLGQSDPARTYAAHALRIAHSIASKPLILFALLMYVRALIETIPEDAYRLIPHMIQLQKELTHRSNPYSRQMMEEICRSCPGAETNSVGESLDTVLADIGLSAYSPLTE
jgi:tetratricopeptide (TPR) repeat protein